MRRLALNLSLLSLIALGSLQMASATRLSAADIGIMAKCGECEGTCCGFDDNGRCWASDNCDPVRPG